MKGSVHGQVDKIVMSVFLSGLCISSFHFNNFIGPTVSGFVIEAIGFRSASLTFVPVYGVLFFVNVVKLLYNIRKNRETIEDTEFL